MWGAEGFLLLSQALVSSASGAWAVASPVEIGNRINGVISEADFLDHSDSLRWQLRQMGPSSKKTSLFSLIGGFTALSVIFLLSKCIRYLFIAPVKSGRSLADDDCSEVSKFNLRIHLLIPISMHVAMSL